MIRPTCIAALLAAASPAFADTAIVGSDKDNTLIEVMGTPVSLGAGDAVYAGRTFFFGSFTNRRGVMHFDVAAAVPEGSTITSATLTLYNTQINNKERLISLHRLSADWGEGQVFSKGGSGGPAQKGDATWVHTFFPDSMWATPGGDFSPTVSASQLVFEPGDYVWGPTPDLTADVQAWLDDPDSNFGWIIIGDEVDTQTVKRLASREYEEPALRPRLTIEFDPPGGVVGDLNGDMVVDGIDIGILLANWSIPPDAPGCEGRLPCPADIDGNGFVNGIDLGILLANWTFPTAK